MNCKELLTASVLLVLSASLALSADVIQKSTEALVVPVADPLASRPTISAPYLAVAPSIDGTVGEEEWKAAARFTGFLDMKTVAPLRYATDGWIGWDDANIYVAFRAGTTRGEPVTAQYGPDERDKPVFRDDSMELWFRLKDANYCFMMNTRGSTADFRSRDRFDWNGEWEGRVRGYEGGYEGEFRVPFKTLGAASPNPGDRWTFNLTRYQIRPYWTRGEFSFMGGKFTDSHPFFSGLVFVKAPTVRVESIGKVRGNKIGVYGHLANHGGAPRQVALRYQVMKADDLGRFGFDAAGARELRFAPIEGATSQEMVDLNYSFALFTPRKRRIQ